MDNQRGSAFRDGRKPYKKSGGGGGWGGVGRNQRPRVPVSDSRAAEDLGEYILKVLAREESAISVVREDFDNGKSRLVVTCDPSVTGRVIGKSGKTITALRELVRAIASPLGRRVDIEVISTDEIQRAAMSHEDIT